MAWIVNLCGKSSGFADFENTVDRGSAVISDADSGLCLSYVRTFDPKQNLEPRSFFSLDRCVNDLVQIISFFKKKSFKLQCETVELYCVVVIKHVAFFIVWAKLTVAFTCTSLPLNLYTSVFGCGCGFGFEQKFWQINGFGGKKVWVGGYFYSPPSFLLVSGLYHFTLVWFKFPLSDSINTTFKWI